MITYIVMELLKKIADAYREQGYNKHHQITVGVIRFLYTGAVLNPGMSILGSCTD